VSILSPRLALRFLDAEQRALGMRRPYDPAAASRSAPPATAACFGDRRRERLAAEGRVGYARPIATCYSLSPEHGEQRREEAEALKDWVVSASPSWPSLLRLDVIIDLAPDDILVGSRDRRRVIVARALIVGGWTRVPTGVVTAGWCRAADQERFINMDARSRAQAIREGMESLLSDRVDALAENTASVCDGMTPQFLCSA